MSTSTDCFVLTVSGAVIVGARSAATARWRTVLVRGHGGQWKGDAPGFTGQAWALKDLTGYYAGQMEQSAEA